MTQYCYNCGKRLTYISTNCSIICGACGASNGEAEKQLRARIAYADDVIASCINQFLLCDEEAGEIAHTFTKAEVTLCEYAVGAGMIEPIEGEHERYRWVKI